LIVHFRSKALWRQDRRRYCEFPINNQKSAINNASRV
jgi:hypothetical protein